MLTLFQLITGTVIWDLINRIFSAEHPWPHTAAREGDLGCGAKQINHTGISSFLHSL